MGAIWDLDFPTSSYMSPADGLFSRSGIGKSKLWEASDEAVTESRDIAMLILSIKSDDDEFQFFRSFREISTWH